MTAFGRGRTTLVGPAFGPVAVPVAVARGGGVLVVVPALVVLQLAFGAAERGLRRLAVGRGRLGRCGGTLGAALRKGVGGENREGCRRHGGNDDIGFHGFTVLEG